MFSDRVSCLCREGARSLRTRNQPLGDSGSGLPHDQRKASPRRGSGGCEEAQKHSSKYRIFESTPSLGLLFGPAEESSVTTRNQEIKHFTPTSLLKPKGLLTALKALICLIRLAHYSISDSLFTLSPKL